MTVNTLTTAEKAYCPPKRVLLLSYTNESVEKVKRGQGGDIT